MLNQFTWQDFITAVLMTGIAYYAIATMLLYHKEIIAFFKANPAQPGQPMMKPAPATTTIASESVSTLQHVSARSASTETTAAHVVVEPSQLDEELVHEAPDPGYTGEELPEEKQAPLELVVEDEQESVNAEDTTLIMGIVSDLLSEMKSLFVVCAENKTPRLEVLRFIRLLLKRYESLRQSQYKESITLYTYHTWNEYLPQQVDLAELAQCWLSSQPE